MTETAGFYLYGDEIQRYMMTSRLERELRLTDEELVAKVDNPPEGEPTDFWREVRASGARLGPLLRDDAARRLAEIQAGAPLFSGESQPRFTDGDWRTALTEARETLGPDATRAAVYERAVRRVWGLAA